MGEAATWLFRCGVMRWSYLAGLALVVWRVGPVVKHGIAVWVRFVHVLAEKRNVSALDDSW